MDFFRTAERSMAMSDAVWMRHANPWSVWTRFTCLPLIILAIWSHVWIGWWAVVPLALACLWTWWNPRAFPPPKRTNNWASKGTFGERVFLNRHAVAIPPHHLRWAIILGFGSAVGMIPLVSGLWTLDVTMTLLGVVLVVLPKVWFVDRMVWLYQDMKDADPAYAAWLKP